MIIGVSTCPNCGGSGKIGNKACLACGGRGMRFVAPKK